MQCSVCCAGTRQRNLTHTRERGAHSERNREQKDLFPKKVTSVNDLKGMYQAFRSLRRSSDSHALNKKVAPTDIDIVNRWEGVESARGQRPGREMKYHYADVVLMLKPFLRYSRAH